MDALTQLTYFYSTLAQTVGALVGLIGAFLISRIVAHIESLGQFRESVWQRILSARSSNRQFMIHVRDDISGAKAAKAHGGTKFDKFIAAAEQAQAATCEFHDNTPIVAHDLTSYVERLRPRLGELRAAEATYGITIGSLESLVSNLDSLRNALTGFQKRVLPKWVYWGMAVLTWLLLTGVVWPMMALWKMCVDQQETPPLLLLVCFVTGVLGLIGFFGWGLATLRRFQTFRWGDVDMLVDQMEQ